MTVEERFWIPLCDCRREALLLKERPQSLKFMLSRVPFGARIKHFYLKGKDHWQPDNWWQSEQDSFHFKATIAGHKFNRLLSQQKQIMKQKNLAALLVNDLLQVDVS